MKRIVIYAMLVCFLLTMIEPFTCIYVHKLAAALLFIFALVHTAMYRNKLGKREAQLLAIIIACFFTGLFGIILDQYATLLNFHEVVSIAFVWFLAIHFFIFRRRLWIRR